MFKVTGGIDGKRVKVLIPPVTLNKFGFSILHGGTGKDRRPKKKFLNIFFFAVFGNFALPVVKKNVMYRQRTYACIIY